MSFFWPPRSILGIVDDESNSEVVVIIELQTDRDIQSQATAAGFASLEHYVMMLLDRDAERVAIREAIHEMNAGQMRPFEEFDAELRSRFGFAPHK